MRRAEISTSVLNKQNEFEVIYFSNIMFELSTCIMFFSLQNSFMNLRKKAQIIRSNFHQKMFLRKEKKGKTLKNAYIFTGRLKSLGADFPPNRCRFST